MSLTGKWKTAKVCTLNEEFDPVWMDEEEYKKSPSYDPEDKNDLFSSCYLFNEDGTVDLLMKIPEDVPQSEIDEAVASGEATVIDGMMLAKGDSLWKEENGTYYINMEAQDVDSQWDELPVDEDGMITLISMFKLKKID